MPRKQRRDTGLNMRKLQDPEWCNEIDKSQIGIERVPR